MTKYYYVTYMRLDNSRIGNNILAQFKEEFFNIPSAHHELQALNYFPCVILTWSEITACQYREMAKAFFMARQVLEKKCFKILISKEEAELEPVIV